MCYGLIGLVCMSHTGNDRHEAINRLKTVSGGPKNAVKDAVTG